MRRTRFHTLAAIAVLGVTSGCATPTGDSGSGRGATPHPVMTGLSTPGQAYIREMTIGAAEGMRLSGWRNPDIEVRVDRAREQAELFRYDMHPAAVQNYDDVRRDGYAQGLMGRWDEAALEGYLDVIEAGAQRFTAITGAGHSDYAWSTPMEAIIGVTGAAHDPFTVDRSGHAVTATALASEINVASVHVAKMIEGRIRIPGGFRRSRLGTV